MLWRKDLPLPTQNCCCHRIEIVHDPAQPKNVSCVVSELASSRLFQMQLYHVENWGMLEEYEVDHKGVHGGVARDGVVAARKRGCVDERRVEDATTRERVARVDVGDDERAVIGAGNGARRV